MLLFVCIWSAIQRRLTLDRPQRTFWNGNKKDEIDGEYGDDEFDDDAGGSVCGGGGGHHDGDGGVETTTVHTKPRLFQVNVRQNLSATDRMFGFTCHNYK